MDDKILESYFTMYVKSTSHVGSPEFICSIKVLLSTILILFCSIVLSLTVSINEVYPSRETFL